MKIGFNPGSIVYTNGAPLQGRVTVYVHDSLEKKDIYTLQASDYVASENPVLLDTAGRIPTTLFFDVSVVDVLVQRYIGEPGQMSDASPDSDFEDFDRFEAGFDFDPSQTSVQAVDSIADLKDIENPSGVVRVNCYATPGDCAPRFYLWNPNCSASEDGGCVIADTHDASGMWCYLCEGEAIHSRVYGITPGNETNINSFCAAPLYVSGDYTVKYPTTLYFDGGTYDSNLAFYVGNGRKMVFSRDAKFLNATFTGYEFDVDGRNASYIADLIISEYQGNRARVYSSWFRTAKGFFGCGANELFIDGSNYFMSYAIDGVVNVYGGQIIASSPMLNLSFTNSSYLNFEGVVFVGGGHFISGHFYGKFTDCNFTDKIFASLSPSVADFGSVPSHKLQVDSWKITDAKNTGNWLKWANASGMTIVDLQGCMVSSTLYNSNIQEFRNGIFAGITISTDVNVSFVDIGGSFTVYPKSTGYSLRVERCKNVNVGSNTPFASVIAIDSIVICSNELETDKTAYAQNGGEFMGIIKCDKWNASSGIAAKGKTLSFENCTMSIGNFSYINSGTFKNCTINNPLHVLPYDDNGDNLLDLRVIGCTFGNNGYIEFTDGYDTNPDVYGLKVFELVIKDNAFYNAGNGVIMPFKNGAYSFMAANQSATYTGNRGGCPAENAEQPTFLVDSVYTEDHSSYKYSAASLLIWNLSNYTIFDGGSAIIGKNGDMDFVTSKLIHEEPLIGSGGQFDVRYAIDASQVGSGKSIKIFSR